MGSFFHGNSTVIQEYTLLVHSMVPVRDDRRGFQYVTTFDQSLVLDVQTWRAVAAPAV